MTDTNDDHSAAALERRYLGEPAPRNPWVAFGLGLLCPGAGWAYVGRLGLGLAANVGAVALWAGFILVWATRKFYPVMPLRAFVIGWVALVLMAALDAAATARQRGPDYVLRESNHPLLYAAVVLFSFVLPLAGLHHIAMHRVWQVVEVDTDAMYPTLVPGDRVLVDRLTRRATQPRPGDVVLYELESSLRFGRVIAVPGDDVALTDDVMFINDAPAVRRRSDQTEHDDVIALSGALDAEVTHFVEEVDGVAYRIVSPRLSAFGEPLQWSLGDDEYLILNDNRSDRTDSRRFGVVPGDDIIGSPTFIGYSSNESAQNLPFALRALILTGDGTYRGARRGRRVQARVSAQ